jgi:hypothetical protein
MTTPISTEELDLVYRAIDQSSRPMNMTNLKKVLPKTAQINETKLKEILISLVESRRILENPSRSTVYWTKSLEEQAYARIVEELEKAPLMKTELMNKFTALRKHVLKGLSEKRCEALLAEWVKQKRIYKVKGFTGDVFIAQASPSARDYVKLAINLALAKLAKKKISHELFYAEAAAVHIDLAEPEPGIPTQPPPAEDPTPQPPLSQLILDEMTRISPAATNGELISITKLREAVRDQIPEKTQFDKTLLELAESGRFVLHRHDYPSSLSQETRDALVLDDRGNYYIGIAIRE